MNLREATRADIARMHVVRMSVSENRLSDPRRVTPEHYREMLEVRGKGWVCEVAGRIVGFAIADAVDRSIWALFVEPGHEGRGIGRALHDVMVEWLFQAGSEPVWLSTDPGTRAARFYAAAGWTAERTLASGELRFVRAR
jgi:GNAT superfamily N-acetyltransferase